MDFCLYLLSELDVTMYAIQVVQEPLWPIWPDDIGVIHVAEPAGRPEGHLLYVHLLKILHEEIGDNRRPLLCTWKFFHQN